MKKDVGLFKSVEYGYLHVSEIIAGERRTDSALVAIARNVEFTELSQEEVVQEEVAVLRNMKQVTLAAAQLKVEEIEEKIQSLLALEYKQ